MKLPKHQAGMAFIGWMLVIPIAGLVLLALLKAIPVYLQHFKVQATLTSIQEQSEPFSGPSAIAQAISRRLSVNDVTNVSREDFTIARMLGDGYDISLEYEARLPFIYNVELVFVFSENIQVH